MENPYSVLSNEVGGAQEDVVDFFKFSSLVPDVKVELSDSNFHDDKFKKFPSLLACSSKYGFFVTGSRTGFQLGQTKLLRETIYKAEKGAAVSFDQAVSVTVKEGDVDILALTSDDLQLIVGVSGGILLTYNISDIVKNKEEALPVQTQTLDSNITFIQPNPEVHRDVIAVITEDNECKLIRYMTSEIIITIPNVSSLCWSRLGKQFVCGTLDGFLEAYDINGNKKDVIEPPSSQTGMLVNAVVWVENHVFLTIYADGQQSHTPYIIKRKMEDPDEKYTLLDEVNPIYIECPESHFYFTIIRNFGKEIKTLITLANTAAGDLSIVGESEDGSWATWIMGETSISLPLSDDDVLDTYPVGLAVDFSASEPLEPFDSAENETPVPPMPVVMFMTNEGRVCAYHAYNFNLAKAGTKYEYMVEAQDLNTIPEPADVSEVPEATATVAAVTGGGFGSFGGAPTKIPAFNSLGSAPKPTSSNNSTPATASPTFGSTSTVGFGTSGFGGGAGAEQKVSFASLAKSSTPTPASPRVSAFGFNSTSSTPAFGQPSGFGTKSDEDNKPVFGSTSAVGQAPVSAFGQTSAIGQAAAPAFGRMSSFGNAAPTFGQTSSVGQSTAPAFGQTSSFGSFGSFGSDKQIDSPFKAKPFGTSDGTTEATAIDPKNPFGATSFAPASIDVDTLVKKANEEPVTKFTEEPTEDASGAKSMFGLPNTSKKQDSNDSCTFSFESVKKDLDIGDDSDADSEISKVSSIDKSKDAFGFSVSPNDFEDTAPVKKYSAGEPIGATTDSDYLQDSDESEDDEDDDIFLVEEEELEKSTEKLGKRTTRKRYDQHVPDTDEFEEDEIEAEENDKAHHADDKKDIKKEDRSNITIKPLENKNNADENTSEEKGKSHDKEGVIKDEETIETVESKRENEIAEEKRKEEEEKRREEERIAEAKRKEEEEKRREEERIAEEKRREQERIAEEKRLEEERIAEEKRREEERIAEEKRLEEERIAEEKRREEARIAEEKRLEEERIAEEKRREEEARRREEARLAAMRQPPVMAVRERTSRPTEYERAAGIKGIAKDFEFVYFETIEDLESTSLLINDIKQDISIQVKTDFSSKHFTQLMDYGFEWRMDDMYDIESMRKNLNDAAEKAENNLLELYNSVTTLLDSTNSLKLEDIRSCLETKEDLDAVKSALEEDSINQISSLEFKSSASENTLKELSEKLNELKKQINTRKSKTVDESKLTMYTMRRTIRDIEKSISEQSKKISILEQEELSLRLSHSQSLSSPIATVYNQNKSGVTPINQRKLFLDQMFQQCKPFNV